MDTHQKLLEIFENRDVVLFDTCAFGPPDQPFYKKNKKLPERKSLLFEKIKHINYLHQFAIKNNFYITNEIYDEILNGLNSKEYALKYEKKNEDEKEISLPPKMISKFEKRTKSLLNIISLNERIIDTKENLSIDHIYFQNKYKYTIRSNSLSKEDTNLLLTGLTLSLSKNSVCLVSNDLGMYNCWENICKSETLNSNKFQFFVYHKKLSKRILEKNYFISNSNI